MTPLEIVLAIGAFCAAVAAIGAVVRWLLKAAIRDINDDAEKARNADAVERARRDADLDSRFLLTNTSLDHLRDTVRNETKDRQDAEADSERRFAHAKANADQKFMALDRRADMLVGHIEDHTRRIIVLEETNKNIDKTMTRMEVAMASNAEMQQTQFDQICQTIREMSQRTPT